MRCVCASRGGDFTFRIEYLNCGLNALSAILYSTLDPVIVWEHIKHLRKKTLMSLFILPAMGHAARLVVKFISSYIERE